VRTDTKEVRDGLESAERVQEERALVRVGDAVVEVRGLDGAPGAIGRRSAWRVFSRDN
jgi:hypothetical protein